MSMDRDFKKEILDFLGNNAFGSTITDIADKIKTTRNTVYRYLAKLEGEDLVFQKKVGRYVLYFSKERRMEFLSNILPIYKNLIKGVKIEFPNKEDAFKKIGRGLADDFTLSSMINGYENLDSLKGLSNKQIFELLRNLLPFLNLLDNNIDVSISNLSEDKSEAIYLIKNSLLLDTEEPYSYHFYLLAGFLEEKLSQVLTKSVKCEILGFEFFNKQEESYIKLSIKIS